MKIEDGTVRDKLRSVWSSVLGSEPVQDDVDFFAAGGTSLDLLRIFVTANQEHGVEINHETISK